MQPTLDAHPVNVVTATTICLDSTDWFLGDNVDDASLFNADCVLASTPLSATPTISANPATNTAAISLADSRFQEVTEEDIQQRIKSSIPANTQQATNWGVRVWNKWRAWKNAKKGWRILPIRECTAQQLGEWLSFFILEVRKEDGSEFLPKSLWALSTAIQREFNDVVQGHRPKVEIFDAL